MSKATVLALVQDLSAAQADATTCERYYRDIVLDLAKRELIAGVTTATIAADWTTFTLPDTCVMPLAIFYDDKLLAMPSLTELEAVNGRWRDERGKPTAAVAMGETDRTYRLYPRPDVDAVALDFTEGRPFGTGFGERNVLVIQTEQHENLPAWLDLPLALAVLAREYARESAHRDPEFSKACEATASLLMGMVG